MDRQKEWISIMADVIGIGNRMHPVDVINALPMADIIEIAIVFKTKDNGVTGHWSSQTNEALCFKAACLTKWAANGIT